MTKSSCSEFNSMARELVGKVIQTDELPLAVEEWKIYQVEKFEDSTDRIDHYWRNVFSIKCKDGSQKFPLLGKVVKAVLVIPHGNSDVERGSSENKRMIGTDRTELNEVSLNGLRTAKDAVYWFDPENRKPENVPLTTDIITSAVAAHKSYKARLESQRLEEERKQSRRDLQKKILEEQKEKEEQIKQQREKIKQNSESISNKEKQLNEKESKSKNRLTIGLELVEDAQKALAEAIEKNDLQRASKAKVMLESGHKECKLAQEELDKITEESNILQTKKSSLILKAVCPSQDSKNKSLSHGSKDNSSSHVSKAKSSSRDPKDKSSSSLNSKTLSKGSSDKRKRNDHEDPSHESKKQTC